jgi:hypothetical protein
MWQKNSRPNQDAPLWSIQLAQNSQFHTISPVLFNAKSQLKTTKLLITKNITFDELAKRI